MVIAPSVALLEHSQPPTRSSQPQLIVPPKKSGNTIRTIQIFHNLFFEILVDTFNFIRPKQGRQAIYSGKRPTRTAITSLQDMCVETLKDNIDRKDVRSFKSTIPFYSI